MEVLIRDCPACGAAVIGDESHCTACGKELPVEKPAIAAPEAAAVAENHCPRCGMSVPRGVLRCRDCGAYMSAEIEAAMIAKQMSRAFSPTGPGFSGGALGSAGSGFAEIADDADFDLNPVVDLIDTAGQHWQNSSHAAAPESETPSLVEEDDFELQGLDPPEEYAVSEAPAATEAPSDGDAPPEPAAAASAENDAAVADVPHSVQTGGDVLLDAALEEERDAASRGRGARRLIRRSAVTAHPPGRFLVFCPNGHRIQVQDKHRGRTGRCPNCSSLFFVPLGDTTEATGVAGGAEAASDAPTTPESSTGYIKWISDVKLHRLNPAKLKLKPGSLADEYEPVDLGARDENLLLAVLFTGGGPFRAMQEAKKKAQTRQEMLEHLKQKLPVADLPVPKHFELTPEQLQQVKIVQPTLPGEESLFADVPVFGEGRIALRLPAVDNEAGRAYLSLTLSQFREFSQMLADVYRLADLGEGTAIPLTDEFQEATCHYSEETFKYIATEKLPWYQADPALKVQAVGRKCQKCGLIVSEDSRKKEKIGGKSESSVAKALCPKCKQKFGSITLYGLPG